MKLRHYQQTGVNNVLKAWRKGHKQQIWTGATGCGKTVIGAEITRRAVKKGNPVLWLVHREEIMRQTVKKLVNFGINPGIIQGKEYMKDSPVHVAMVQTLVKRMDFFLKNGIKFPIIIPDEAHHDVSKTRLEIFEKTKEYIPDCCIVGLTASPIRTDNVGLSSAGYTALINGPQYANLLYDYEKPYLAEPVIIYSSMTAELSRAKGKRKRKDYDPEIEGQIFGEKIVVNNAVDLYNKYFCGAPCIFFCASVSDCFEVSAAMQAVGWKGGAVVDRMDHTERKDLIEGLGDGRYNFVCSYDIINEGTDVPAVAGCIKRRRTFSLGIDIQQNGRPARMYPGKKYNLIVDQCGNSLIHGHPLTMRNWTLDGIIKSEKDEQLKEFVCFNCGAMLFKKYNVCPYCGESLKGGGNIFEHPLKEVEAPMSILPAPTYAGCSEMAEIQEYDEPERESAIEEGIKQGRFSSFDRFGELAKMLGKDDKWTRLVWRKYHA